MRTILASMALVILAGGGPAASAAAQDAPPIREGRGEFEMVLIHDIGSNAAVWDDLAPYLQGTFDVWRFELSGHGHTAPVARASIAAEAERLAAFLAEEGVVYPTLGRVY